MFELSECGSQTSQFSFCTQGGGIDALGLDLDLVLVFELVAIGLVAIAARVSALATCQTGLIQQCRTNQLAIGTRSRSQVMRRVFLVGLPCIKTHLAKGGAFLAWWLRLWLWLLVHWL